MSIGSRHWRLEASSQRLIRLLWLFVLLAGFVAWSQLSPKLRIDSAGVVLYVPLAGLSAAIVSLAPRRWRPTYLVAIFAGTVGVRAMAGTPFPQGLAYAAGNVCEALVFASLVDRFGALVVRRLESRRVVLKFIAAAFLSAAAGAVVAVTGLLVVGVAGRAFGWLWFARTGAEVLGILSVAPLVFLGRDLKRLRARRWLELACLAVLLVVCIDIGFEHHGHVSIAFVYVPLALLLFGVVRLGTPAAALLPLVLVPLSAWRTAHGHGAFARLTGFVFEPVYAAQIYGFTATMGAWLIAGLLAERLAVAQALEEANRGLEARIAERTAELAKRARQAQAAADVSQALSEAGLDETAAMEAIAADIATALSDVCLISRLCDDRRSLVPFVVCAPDPAVEAATREAFFPLTFDALTSGLTGRAFSIHQTVRAGGSPEELAAVSRPELGQLFFDVGLHSAMVAPMRSGDRILGAITVLRHKNPGDYDDEEAEFLQDLADRAGLALANAQLHAQLEASEARFRSAFEHAPVGALMASLEPENTGQFLWVNPAFCQLTGYSQEELLAMNYRDLMLPDGDGEEMLADLGRGSNAEAVHRQRRCLRGDGRVIWVRVNASPSVGDGPARTIAHVEDVTAQKEAEAELTQRALYDPLTGLANRNLLMDRLALALRELRRARDGVAVLYIDLDGFKEVNDTLGHEAGDEVIRQVGARIAAAVRSHDIAGRLAGDEFVVVSTGIVEDVDAIRIAERIEAALAEPIRVGEEDLDVEASIGVSVTNSRTADAHQLLRQADLAMYRAKKGRQRAWELYSEALQDQVLQRLSIQHDLRRALDQGWLRLHYQPIVDLDQGRVVGAEALLRIAHPDRGLLGPAAFIEVAEDSHLIVPIGEWVLHEACAQLARWRSAEPLEMAINVSGRQASKLAVTGKVLEAAMASGTDPAHLSIEMTERVLIEAGDSVVKDLKRLTEHGVRLALDDFGTGYSSLTYLQRFPIKIVKIDRSFVSGLGLRRPDTAIVEAVSALAYTLDLTAVAEGVENQRQLETLRRLGCHRAQGFHFSRPLPPEEMTRLVETRPVLPGRTPGTVGFSTASGQYDEVGAERQ